MEVGDLEPHPNADTLDITKVYEYPVIVKRGTFKKGDRAVYVPSGSVAPKTEEWSYLGSSRRIKAKKLRGVFSMGVLMPSNPEWPVGKEVADQLGITKYMSPQELDEINGPVKTNAEAEADPGFIPLYTDIEAYRRFPNILRDGEPVIITEKIHGANARFLYKDGRLWVGSHRQIKREGSNLWWTAAKKYDLANRLKAVEGFTLYGEVYGAVQDLKYGLGPGEVELRLFDVVSPSMTFLDYPAFFGMAESLQLEVAPELYVGAWNSELLKLAEGKTVTGKDREQIREGMVIRPLKERWDARVGRVIIKHVGEGYLTRKDD